MNVNAGDISGNSFKKMKNKMGPIIDPCGTPYSMPLRFDF